MVLTTQRIILSPDENDMEVINILFLIFASCAFTTANNNKTKAAEKFNLTHIVIQAILYCGPSFVCDKSYLAHFNISYDAKTKFSACGPCHCNEACNITLNECCPDVYFKYGYMQCEDLSLVRGTAQPQFYSVISTCEEDTTFMLSRNCSLERSTEELIRTPPVSSDISRRTYKNRYCALCNNVTDFQEWNFELNCQRATDINYLSTYTEIIQLAKDRNCYIHFSTTSLSIQMCPKLNEKKIASCNVSGTWQVYDEIIELACLSGYRTSVRGYIGSYVYGFENVFCAMCNPPKFDPKMYRKTCRDTKSIYYAACKNHPIIEASFPFKNHFCLTCNHGDQKNVLQEMHIKYIQESYETSKVHPFVTKLGFSFKSNHLKEYVNRKTSEWYNVTQHYSPLVSFPVNVSSLVRLNFALLGEGSCNKNLLPNYTIPLQRACSCDIGCTIDCCVDFALLQPWTCIEDHYPFQNLVPSSDDTRYLTIGGCLRKHDNVEHLCINRNKSDFYQMLPVTSYSKHRETYANIFCYLCNQNEVDDKSIESITTDTMLWLLITECKGYINHKYFSMLQDYLNFAELQHCFIKFKPFFKEVSCKTKSSSSDNNSIVSECNNLSPSDEDLKYACEKVDEYRFPKMELNGTIYKNKFCIACNSIKTQVSDSCQVSSDFTALLNKACQEFPKMAVCSNYRNIFCEICAAGTPSHCLAIDEEDGGPNLPPMPSLPPIIDFAFRSMFSILDYDKESLISSNTLSCTPEQVYDGYYDTCQNISCFPGKVMANRGCLSILAKTTNLRYTIALKTKFNNIPVSNFSVYHYMREIRQFLIKRISQKVKHKFFVENMLLVASVKCNSKLTKSSEFYVYLKIFFQSYVNRQTLEDSLITFTNSSFSMTFHYFNIWNVQLMQNQFALFLPSLLWKSNLENNCWLFPEELKHGDPVFRNVFVDSLLTCPQILIKGNAFGVTWENIKTSFSFEGQSLKFHQFNNFDGNGKRVCVRDIQHYIEHYQIFQNEDLGKMPLTILTIVCIGISLVCLVLTFATYMTFPSLRTIPGLNNVFLILSLFTAQIMLLVRQLSIHEDYSTLTIVVSALTHFSWLSIFFWLQVCSYHMFVEFTSKLGKDSRKDSPDKTVVKYAVYAYGASLAIVLLNMVISLITTSGRDTGYDKISTLFTYKIAYIVTFIAPFVYVCATNMIFYIVTIYKIKSCPQVDNTSGNRVHFAVYIKLFSLTGFTWILQIIDTFLVVSVLSYFVTVLNGLQGLFIFISYVCNIRVMKMWRKICSPSLFRPTPSQRTSDKSETTSL